MSYASVTEFPRSPARNPPQSAHDLDPSSQEEGVLENAIALRGLAGIVLGLFELAMPNKVIELDGLDQDSKNVVRVAGAHKVITGIGLLTSEDKRPWLMAALGGSLYDGAALASRHANTAAYGRLAIVATVDAVLLGATNLRILEDITF